MASNLKSKKCFIVISSLLFIFIFSTYSQGAKSQFQIFGMSNRESYDGGDDVKVQIMIDGLGKIRDGYLYSLVPDYIVQNQQLEVLSLRAICGNTPNPIFEDIIKSNGYFEPFTGYCCVPYNMQPNSVSNGFIYHVNFTYFEPDCDTASILSNQFFSIDGQKMAPLNIKFRLRKDAPAGQHPLYMSFTYKEDDEVIMSYYVINIKVRAWYERQWVQILIFAGLIVTIIASIIAIFSDGILPLFHKEEQKEQPDKKGRKKQN